MSQLAHNKLNDLPNTVDGLLWRMMAELTCPICLQMVKVATATPCGHTFCRHCILRCLESNYAACPVCKQELNKRRLFASTSIDCIAQEFKELRAAYEHESGNVLSQQAITARRLRHEPVQDLSQKIPYPSKDKVPMPTKPSSVDPDATYVTSIEIERAQEVRDQIRHGPTPDTFVIATSHVTDMAVKRDLQRLVRREPYVSSAKDMTDDVTHLAVPTDENKIASRTIKLLQATLMGKWIVSQEWITACCEKGRMIPVDSYLVRGVNRTAGSQHALQRAREHLAQGGPRLFEGFCFYLYGEFVRPTKVELEALIRLAGGRLVESPDLLRESDGEMICAEVAQQSELRHLHHRFGRVPVTTMWIMDSVSAYEIQTKQTYYACEIPNSTLSRQ